MTSTSAFGGRTPAGSSGRLLPSGETAVLAEVADLDAALALYRRLDSTRPPGVVDLVLGARTVLAVGRTAADLPSLRAALAAALDAPTPEGDSVTEDDVTLDVVYDGPDLAAVATLLGWTPQQVIDAHTGTPWRVAFAGFAPGFAYLTGGDPRLAVPRRPAPRTSVPAGSVGLAGAYSGVYPRSSPGGWQLLGTTDAALWDLTRPSPALLRPGMTVRFRSASAPPAASEPGDLASSHIVRRPEASSPPNAGGSPAGPQAAPAAGRALLVTASGLTTVQDAGRHGWAHVGVPVAGPADRAAWALANRLVGNPGTAAALEITLGGLEIVATTDLMLAATGAHAPATSNGTPLPHGVVWFVAAGDTIRLGRPVSGLRTYLAVSGGIATDPVLGSRSTDTLSGLGPGRVREGDLLPVGPQPPIPLRHPSAVPGKPPGDGLALEVAPGPRRDWLAEPDALAGPWIVSGDSDRIGVRLSGTPLRRHPDHDGEELPSEGVVRGAVQLPAGGQPVVFGADHPVTGGYPVVGVLTSASSDMLAQARPGQTVTLHWTR